MSMDSMVSIKGQIQYDIAERQKKVDELLIVERVIDQLPECMALLPYDYVSITPWGGLAKTIARIFVSTHKLDQDWIPLMKQTFEREVGVIFADKPEVTTFGSIILEGEWELDDGTHVDIVLNGPPTKKCVMIKVPVVVKAKPAVEAEPEKIIYKKMIACPGVTLPEGAILIDEAIA